MVTIRLHWSDLPGAARKAITTTTGPVNGAGTLPGGYNSEIAVRFDTGHTLDQ
ncbi:hypothetical protein [Streptomyces sp. NPDC005538]|uniref:hypothetical protein n=1 Tax=Streptomyces sp. NPDC005538 TaxID=3157043 RepID=UPI0033B63E17